MALNYKSWSDTTIVISGFGDGYGLTSCDSVSIGDAVSVEIWNTSDASSTELQTAWGGFVMPGPDSLTLFIENRTIASLSPYYLATGEQDTLNLMSGTVSALEDSGVTISQLTPRLAVGNLPSSVHIELSEAALLIDLPQELSEWTNDFLEVGAWLVPLDISGSFLIPGPSPLEIAGTEVEGVLTAIDQQEQGLFEKELCQEGQSYSIVGPQQQLTFTLTGLSIPKSATLDLSSLDAETLEYGQGGLLPQACPSGGNGYVLTQETLNDLLNCKFENPDGNSVSCFGIKALITTQEADSTSVRQRRDVTIELP